MTLATSGGRSFFCTIKMMHIAKPKQQALLIKPEHQMMPDVQKLFKDLKRVEVYDNRKIGGWTEREVADFAKKELQETGSVLVVVNTKKAAVNIFQLLQNLSGVEIYHLSTSMCPAHRMNVLKCSFVL